MPPKVGQVIHSKYRLLRHIGDGGMGSVYEARHETLGTTVALKFLHLEFSRREGLVQRFLQEARASARIQSPHVVRVADVDQTPDGDVFIVLEYLEGKTLQELYEELYRGGRRLSYAEALDYAEQILDGVDAAHQAGIVHRDLKPDNVMITVDARGATVLKLLDFGIAKLKVIGHAPGHDGGSRPQTPGDPSGRDGGDPGPAGLTRPGVMMGTPEYMAPEQASSADTVDARADIFSLGVMIFEMLGGQRPVGGDDPHDLAAAYRSGQVAQLADLVPGMAPELAAAVHRAMAPDPRDRFSTAADMHEAIEPFAAAVRAPSPSRLRAGGTIGVSQIAPAPGRAAPLAAPPPPTAGDRASAQPIIGHVGGHPQTPGRTTPQPPIAAGAPRPGGVAKTWPPDEDPLPAPLPHGGGTVVDAAGSAQSAAFPRDSTRRMDEPYAPGAPPPAGETHRPLGPPASLGRRPAPRRRKGISALGVVLTAAGVAGLVMCAVYLGSHASSGSRDRDRDRDRDEPPPPRSTSAVPATTADPQPPPPAEPPPFVPSQPGPGPAPRPGPGGVRPRPSPSGTPSAGPSAPPPAIIIPTAFPFPNPFQQTPPPPGSGAPPRQQDPPPLFPL